MKHNLKVKVKPAPPRNPDIFDRRSCRKRAREFIDSAKDEIRLALEAMEPGTIPSGDECKLLSSAREVLRRAHTECCHSYRNESAKQIRERIKKEEEERMAREKAEETKEMEVSIDQNKDMVNSDELV
jgi:sugar-specific transcriptional regulator TrmB